MSILPVIMNSKSHNLWGGVSLRLKIWDRLVSNAGSVFEKRYSATSNGRLTLYDTMFAPVFDAIYSRVVSAVRSQMKDDFDEAM